MILASVSLFALEFFLPREIASRHPLGALDRALLSFFGVGLAVKGKRVMDFGT